ncbi:MAG: shikimate dehydrogenase, partial [Dehalococcoidia bacterium]|nr:shikimate dehydrogenase [Dehalococcoidia bacterium]
MTESNGTSICGIVGSPVTHSLSPVIHNAAFKHMGLDYLYLSFDTPHGNLQSRLAEIREYSYRGVNVTIPNKVAVLPFLDKLEPLARRIGAVNTIVNQKGSLKGYNTDAGGFMLPLLSIGFKPQGKHVLLLGAGGAARAIAYALAVKGALVTIMNRPAHFDKAQELAANIGVVTGHPVKALPLNRLLIAEEMSQTALLVNTTSVGMF